MSVVSGVSLAFLLLLILTVYSFQSTDTRQQYKSDDQSPDNTNNDKPFGKDTDDDRIGNVVVNPINPMIVNWPFGVMIFTRKL